MFLVGGGQEVGAERAGGLAQSPEGENLISRFPLARLLPPSLRAGSQGVMAGTLVLLSTGGTSAPVLRGLDGVLACRDRVKRAEALGLFPCSFSVPLKQGWAEDSLREGWPWARSAGACGADISRGCCSGAEGLWLDPGSWR